MQGKFTIFGLTFFLVLASLVVAACRKSHGAKVALRAAYEAEVLLSTQAFLDIAQSIDDGEYDRARAVAIVGIEHFEERISIASQDGGAGRYLNTETWRSIVSFRERNRRKSSSADERIDSTTPERRFALPD